MKKVNRVVDAAHFPFKALGKACFPQQCAGAILKPVVNGT